MFRHRYQELLYGTSFVFFQPLLAFRHSMLWAVCRPSGGKAPVMIELWMIFGFYLILNITYPSLYYNTKIFGTSRVTLPLVCVQSSALPTCVGSLPCWFKFWYSNHWNLSRGRPCINWASMAVSQVGSLASTLFTCFHCKGTNMNQEPIIQCFQGDEGSGARTRRVFGASNVCRGLVLHRGTGSKEAGSNLWMVAVWLRLRPRFYQQVVFLLVFLVPDNDDWRYESPFCVQILCLQFHPMTWSLRRSLTWRCWFYEPIRITNSQFGSSPIKPGIFNSPVPQHTQHVESSWAQGPLVGMCHGNRRWWSLCTPESARQTHNSGQLCLFLSN